MAWKNSGDVGLGWKSAGDRHRDGFGGKYADSDGGNRCN